VVVPLVLSPCHIDIITADMCETLGMVVAIVTGKVWNSQIMHKLWCVSFYQETFESLSNFIINFVCGLC